MKKTKTAKPYWEMTADELAEATKEFDKPIPQSRFKPLSAKQRAVFEKAIDRDKRQTIVLLSGSNELRVKLDKALAKKLDEYAAKNKTTLPEMIDKGLRGLIAFG